MLTPTDPWGDLPPLGDDDVPPDYDDYPEPDVPDVDVRELEQAAEVGGADSAGADDADEPSAGSDYPVHADGHPGAPLTLQDRETLINKRGLTETFLSSPHIAAAVRSVPSVGDLPPQLRWSTAESTNCGVLYLWRDPKSGAVTPQFRPHTPTNPDAKYVFPKGAGSPVWLVSGDLPDLKHTVYVVEGTNQALAWACAFAHDPSVVVVAIAGCNGGVKNGVLHSGLAHVVRRASKVVVVPDGDVASNRRVYDAYATLGDRIRGYMRAHGNGGRATVTFVQIHADADDPTAGADDLLAQTPELDRHALLTEMTALSITTPSEVRPPADRRRPKSADATGTEDDGEVYFSQFGGGLRSKACASAVQERLDLLLDAHSSVLYTYDAEAGIYVPDRNAGTKHPSAPIADVLTDLVGDDYRSGHVASVLDHVHKSLAKEGRLLPEKPLTDGLLPTRTCLVDMETGETFPHAPEARLAAKLSVEFDPDATAPTFEKWLAEATRLSDGTDQVAIVLDALTTLLDTASGISLPTLALYLYGPPRAGKGTMGKLIQAMVPVEAQTAMSLADMAGAKPFDTAVLYRKLLNVSGETSDNYIGDTALMKQVFGEDYIRGELKFGKSWPFKNTAATVFMGNDLPHFSDVSGATGARIQPIKFTKSHVGQEDRTLYPRLEEELPGILNLIIAAWRERKARKGSFLPAAPEAVEAFIEATNPVAGFMRDRVEKAPEEAWADPRTGVPTQSVEPEWGTTVTELYAAYRAYCETTGGKSLKRDRFLKAISRPPFSIRDGRTRATAQRRVLGCRLVSEDDDAPTIATSNGHGGVDIALTASEVEARALREEQERARAKANIDRVVRIDTSSARTDANAFGEGATL